MPLPDKSDGVKTYYDLFINKAADSYIPEDVVRANNGLDTYSMDEESEVFNIFILNKKSPPLGNTSRQQIRGPKGGEKPKDIADNGEH